MWTKTSMPNVYFIADLHLGHRKILAFSKGHRSGTTTEEHDEWIIKQWNSVVHKRDIVYVLGDVAFGRHHLEKFKRLNGKKVLVRGNHDKLSTATYLEYFTNVLGSFKKYNFWISHFPIHPHSMQDKFNIHGHVHFKGVRDKRYINVSVDALDGVPIDIQQLRKIARERMRKGMYRYWFNRIVWKIRRLCRK